jgi:hypothetical protein
VGVRNHQTDAESVVLTSHARKFGVIQRDASIARVVEETASRGGGSSHCCKPAVKTLHRIVTGRWTKSWPSGMQAASIQALHEHYLQSRVFGKTETKEFSRGQTDNHRARPHSSTVMQMVRAILKLRECAPSRKICHQCVQHSTCCDKATNLLAVSDTA